MSTITDLFLYLEQQGILDTLLPFFLVFAVTFAIFEKIKIFGDEKRNINTAVALILGFAVVLPHLSGMYPPGADVVDIINTALPQVSAVVIALVSLFLMIGVFAPEVRWYGGSVAGGIVVIAGLIVLYIFGNAASWWTTPTWLTWFGPDTQSLVLILVVFVGLVLFIVSEPSSESGGIGKVLENVSKVFGGK